MINVGHRPTLHGEKHELRVEAHIIGEEIAENELYNQKAAVYFCKRLREEKVFEDIEQLKNALQMDREKTIKLKSKLFFQS